MSAPVQTARVLRFDIFELDLRAGQLRKRGVRLRLQGQPLQVLATLLKHAGEVVTREELRGEIWSADTFVDFDHSLHNAIARVRDLLGDSPESPRYIETLPRRGYKFIAPVEEVQPVEAPQLAAENSQQSVEPGVVTARTMRRAGFVLALCFCCAIGLGAWVAWRHFHVNSEGPSIRSLAVLPMANLSGDAGQDYFADGMTEELITELSRIHALKVISAITRIRSHSTCSSIPMPDA